jgi:hypothetical protein
MKDFKEVVKLRTVPTTFVFRCSLCSWETRNFDRHFGLIDINEHLLQKHQGEVNTLDKEELYSRKPIIELQDF